jgi:leucyl aminopeptidase
MKRIRVLLLAVFMTALLVGNTFAQGLDVSCGYDNQVDLLLGQSDLGLWLYWVEVLSGERPAQLDGFPFWIRTRNTRYMFDDSADARAYDYVLQQVNNWYPDTMVTEQSFLYGDIVAKNIIVTMPGKAKPDEHVLLVAHLDDTSWNSVRLAPGANDNAIGAATLLEVARLFRQLQFDRSIRLIWFTGEEAGTLGSRAYMQEYSDFDYHGVINLDMFGWDGDGDRCFEIHVGDLAASDDIGTCFAESITAYSHNLIYDYLVTGATSRSDHINFWLNGIGAIAITENATEYGSENGCVGEDMNPNYHTKEDTIQINLTLDYAYDIARAAMESTAALAGPISDVPKLSKPILAIKGLKPEQVSMAWTDVPLAKKYRVYRSSFGCEDWGGKLVETSEITWKDETILSEWPYQYRIEAVFVDGVTVSQPSNCVAIGPAPPPSYSYHFFPAVFR